MKRRKPDFWGQHLADFFEAWTRPGRSTHKFFRTRGEVWGFRGAALGWLAMIAVNLALILGGSGLGGIGFVVILVLWGYIGIVLFGWLIAFFAARRRLLNVDFLICPSCWYPLALSKDGAAVHCPECGFTGDRAQVRDGWERKYLFHFKSAPPIAGERQDES